MSAVPRRGDAIFRRCRFPLIAALILSILLPLDLTTAVAIEEPDRLWRVGLGAFADKLYPTARDVLEQFVARYPRDRRAGDAWLLLGKMRAGLGDLGPAVDAVRRAGKLPSSPEHALEAPRPASVALGPDPGDPVNDGYAASVLILQAEIGLRPPFITGDTQQRRAAEALGLDVVFVA